MIGVSLALSASLSVQQLRHEQTIDDDIGGAMIVAPGCASQRVPQMDDGQVRTLTYASEQNLKVGQRVRLADGVLQPS